MVNPGPPPPGPGSTFGPYRIDSVIATGRTGVLYRATDQRLGRQVALKVVAGTLASSPEFVERFQREAATLARLESPHVVQIFDHGVQDGLPFLTSQYAAGGDLGTLLGRLGPMPPLLAAQACSQVAEALRDAHRAGVVHRNLKPSNVLLRDDRLDRIHVLVCDFGVGPAEGGGAATEPASAPGAWSYLAPERIQGQPGSEAADVYAVGCLLHEAVTGRPPYTGTDVEVASAHLQAPVPQLPGGDESTQRLNQVLARCLAKDPAQRYPSAGALRDDLRAWAGIITGPPAVPPSEQLTMAPGAPPPFAPPPPPYAATGAHAGPGSKGPDRKLLLIAGAAALALVLVLGIVIAVVAGGDDEPEAAPTTSEPTPAGPSTADPSTVPTEPTETEPTETEPTGPSEPVAPDLSGAVAGDLDGDGLGDLTLLTFDGLRLLSSTGTAFGDPVLRRNRAGLVGMSGDLDEDGTTDLVRVLGEPPRMNASSSTGGSSPLRTPARPDVLSALDVAMALGDVDGDGSLDLVAATRLGPTELQVDVAIGDGAGTFAPTTTWYSGPVGRESEGGIFVADVDEDGTGDVVHVSIGRLTDFAPMATVLVSDGTALAVTGETTEVDAGGFAVGSVVSGDFDGDGFQEIASTTADNLQVKVWSWNGSTFDQESWFDDTDNLEVPEVAGSDLAASDVDGDGFDDLVVLGATRDFVPVVNTVFLSEGTSFTRDDSWRRPVGLDNASGYNLLTSEVNAGV
ncbi:MAG: Serine/threonine protein kinase [Nocardioides sp.]|nr:Serine/threonine protein kinase [Nocardioides sp.]